MNSISKKILLVENNPEDARFLQDFLPSKGEYKFKLTHSGQLNEALKHLAEESFDLVLLDLSIPESLGLDSISRVHAQAPDVPVIVLTNDKDETTGKKAAQDGAQDYLVKGHFDANLLTRSARYAIEQHRMQKQLIETREQLIHTQKMSSTGTMVASIAHELNNPMMGLLNFVQYCLKHTEKDDKRYSVLQDAEREAKRCSTIVQNLLAFSRMEKQGEERRKQESCSEIFERVFRLLAYRIEKQHITINKSYAEGTPSIWMKPTSIEQVFLNLINNALDALETSDTKQIRVDIHREGNFVRIIVTDTGNGISDENLKNIFQPFFTTKPDGQGTGVGLSVSRTIIKEHRGEITCESRVGVGTEFKILLPIEMRKGGRRQNE